MASKSKPGVGSASKAKKRPNDDGASSSKEASGSKKAKGKAADDDWDGPCTFDPSDDHKKKGKASYFKFKQRGAPAALGSKELPEGPEDCLTGLDFVITGVLDSLQREDAEDLIKRHGGLVKAGVSKKTSYVVAGVEPGESKLKKARELKTTVIDEDGLFDLIRNAASSKPKPSTASNGKAPSSSKASSTSTNGKTASSSSKPSTSTNGKAVSLVKSNGSKNTAEPEAKRGKKAAPSVVVLDSDDEDFQPVAKKLKKDAVSPSPSKKMAPIFSFGSASKPSAKPSSTAKAAVLPSPSKTKKEEVDTVAKPTAKKTNGLEAVSKPTAKSPAPKAGSSAVKSPPVKVKKEEPLAPPSQSSVSQSSCRGRDKGLPPSQPSTSSSQSFSPSPSSRLGSQLPFVLWVDKYAPKTLMSVVGQHTPASPANKLVPWLRNWHANRKKYGYKATASGFFGQKAGGDGAEFKAVLLSGPPGLGKTTTAVLACKETGFTFIHKNASDSRSKKILDNEVMGGVGTHSLLEFFSPSGGTGAGVLETKSALIMDEVDGMAGNEDRGGIAEVIQLIKNAKVPIICICNDRSSQKIRSLAGYCFDLRFHRPRLEQIRGAMMSVCAKEGIKIAPNALDAIITGAHQDMRQTLHNLYTWTISKKVITYDDAKASATLAEKDSIKVGPFEACRAMFQPHSGKRPSSVVDEKMDLYFEDYSFVPLFVQQNYLNVQSRIAKNVYQELELISKTADSLSLSDLVDRDIRSKQQWSLLPIHAVFSAVLPGNFMQGSLQKQIEFPVWLGKNSTTNKNKRLIEELRAHMHLRINCNVTGLNLDYLPVMRRALTIPLKKGEDGIEEVVNFVNSYDLLREDMEPIMDVTTWEGMKDPLKDIPPAIKSSLTRQLNKGTHLNPYSTTDVKKGRGKAASSDEGTELMDEETQAALAVPDEEEEAVDDNALVEKDPMIKAKKPRAAPGTSKPRGKDAASTSRGGRGGGRGASTASTSRRGKK
ncbi:Replication factor C subunit 1 [Hypsibius exemplaris]|uniref:Replication factor C subunit 1 n=1 Tax=Hypsibius exemplaris TaxID=2072580 RepID=A0A1W0XAG7_HYPEX|nr:Replication factor C subunit 1 [Hypsibius exemplaris]